MKRVIEKPATILLILALAAALVACGKKEQDAWEETMQTADGIKSYRLSQPSADAVDASFAGSLQLVSDDSHFVMEKSGLILSYEYNEEEEIIGCKGFYDVGDADTAKVAVGQYDNGKDERIESVTSEGTYLVFIFNTKAYVGLSRSTLDLLYGEEKITE